jgi:hypothetical protein
MSVFDRRAQEATDYLRKWILVYLSAISERSIGVHFHNYFSNYITEKILGTTESFHPVLTAVASTAREPAAIATGKPYLADAIAALKASVTRLSSLLTELQEMSTQTGRLGLDEVDEVNVPALLSQARFNVGARRLLKLHKYHSWMISIFHNDVPSLHANWQMRRRDTGVKSGQRYVCF